MKTKEYILEFIETGVVSFLVIMLIYAFVASVELISGSSMEPNFHDGERILVDKISPSFEKYRRGEVVVIIPPGETKHFLKRIIGLPGDIVKIYDCKIFITNFSGKFMLEETYLVSDLCTRGGLALSDGHSIKLGDSEYIVLGDNREYSVDSRYFGVVTNKSILGRVIFRLWPAKRFGFVS